MLRILLSRVTAYARRHSLAGCLSNRCPAPSKVYSSPDPFPENTGKMGFLFEFRNLRPFLIRRNRFVPLVLQTVAEQQAAGLSLLSERTSKNCQL